MGNAALSSIDPGGVNAGVPQDVCQAREILFHTVKRPSEEMPQIVREYFCRLHPRTLAQLFHIPPDVGAIQRLSIPADKHRSGSYF